MTKDITLSKAVAGLKAAIALVRSKGRYDIGLIGSSFGGLLSLIATSQDSDIKMLALKSPVTEPIKFWQDRLGDERIAKWKQNGLLHYHEHGENYELDYRFWEDLVTYDTFKMAKNITCPILLIHGSNDTVVPIKQSDELAEIVKTEVKVIKGADHDYADPAQHNEMKKLITDFFIKKLSPL